jgi:hypothetical protein
MLLNEMFNEYPDAYRDVQSDQTVLKFGDIRKTKLTLAQINLLRKMNDQRKIEYAAKLKQVKQQYGAPPASAVV